MAVNVCCVATAVGVGAGPPVPLPQTSLPQQNARPPKVIPHVWNMPAESALNRSVVATRSAESAATLGTPSWRKMLLPQQYASPPDVNPHACASPTARLTRTMSIGTRIFGPALNASRLLQKTRSSLRIAQYLCSKNAMSRVEVTCTRASARALPLAATIVARPSARALTIPESETLAMAGAALLQ